MIVTSLSALAASVRSTLARGRSNAVTPSPASGSTKRVSSPASAVDSVTLSTGAVTPVEALDPETHGDATNAELSQGAIDVLKRASVRFHHRRIGKGPDQTVAPTSTLPKPAAARATTPLVAAVNRKYGQ